MHVTSIIGAVALLSLVGTGAQAGNPLAGKDVWENNSCPSCHGLDGNPVVAGVPSFRKGERMIKPDMMLAETMIKGAGTMPSWKGVLSQKEIFDVITYIRTLRKYQ